MTQTFQIGDLVQKVRGSNWRGRICGTYSTSLTPEGYAVESAMEPGNVQIYPVAALKPWEGNTRTSSLSDQRHQDFVTATAYSCGHDSGAELERKQIIKWLRQLEDLSPYPEGEDPGVLADLIETAAHLKGTPNV